uniref:Uncharacterized protein n=1 Tax=Cucumis melo TaxID=3656 RepID=A0A9I9E588_CUCME
METLVLGFPFRVSIIPILPLKSLHSLICPLADFSPSSSPSTLSPFRFCNRKINSLPSKTPFASLRNPSIYLSKPSLSHSETRTRFVEGFTPTSLPPKRFGFRFVGFIEQLRLFLASETFPFVFDVTFCFHILIILHPFLPSFVCIIHVVIDVIHVDSSMYKDVDLHNTLVRGTTD